MKKLLILVATLAFTATVRAQDWPTKPVRFIVPYPPGGGTDVIARIAVVCGRCSVSSSPNT